MLAVTSPTFDTSTPAPEQDADWVRAAAQGDRKAFEALYRRHVKRIFGLIWRLVGGVEARAEELTQEAFIKAWQALPGFRGDSAFSTWLHRLAVNTALMHLRARSAGEDREVDDQQLQLQSGPAASRGLQIDLQRAVDTLPPRARAVLVLYDVEGWSHEEIGQQLGMAVGSSKAQLHRARGLLRQRLEGHGHE